MVRKITCSQVKPVKFYSFDSSPIEFNKRGFNIRKSNTEPCLRLLVEAKNPELLKSTIQEIKSLINRFE